jgi:hypothetical protein
MFRSCRSCCFLFVALDTFEVTVASRAWASSNAETTFDNSGVAVIEELCAITVWAWSLSLVLDNVSQHSGVPGAVFFCSVRVEHVV